MAHNPVREEQKKKIIEALNSARSMELHAIHQYMVQHYDLDNMDYGDMAMKVKLIAIDEMRHAEMLADRIEELSGLPTSDLSATVEKGQSVETVFSFDTALEDEAMTSYNRFILVCRENGDSTSEKLLQLINDEEQVHYNYFDNVTDHLEKLGQVYLAQIAGTPSSTGLNTQGFVARLAAAPAGGA
ncbi:MAG: ferritin-like domain-containing protein [Syntrophorhabdales bacterium]|jgi:bacterioferritin